MISAELGQGLETFVAAMIDTGRYESEDEVVRAGVRLLQQHEARLAELHAALDHGIADLRAGRVRDADEVFDELETKYARIMHGHRDLGDILFTD